MPKSDIEIAREATMQPIAEVGAKIDIPAEHLLQYGPHKAKVSYDFIKSLRGSDPDAGLYWLHTMLEAGEDPRFIARRMIVLASEDIGLADSQALGVAIDAARALEVVGLPEAAYALSHAATYLALAPKSNSITTAMGRARQAVADSPGSRVPEHLRSQAPPGAYTYPHDFPGGVVPQQYLPDGLEELSLYQAIDRGDEGGQPDR